MLDHINIWTPTHWKDYELIDSGEFEKLERFGARVLRRPEPQAVWGKSLRETEWKKRADATFVQSGSASGTWEKKDADRGDQWFVHYQYKEMNLRFRLGLTGFKHVGLFPEQALNWNFIYDNCRRIPDAGVLNLFAYTGGASLAARAGGADVIHCDSIRQVVNWAHVNQESSGLKGIRWLVEDAFRFVAREAKRGKKYQGIILDPPAWGHGPNGEKWKLEEQINELMHMTAKILDEEKSFLVFNAYSLGFSSLILGNLVDAHFGQAAVKATEAGELVLVGAGGRKLPAGVTARFAV
jgi:23S rRNA (cytosine1962-C5)-methyltransferase